MKNFRVAILGNNYVTTTQFVEDIIQDTNADKDQEHIKMNIVINNKLLNMKNEELYEIVNNLKSTDSTYLCLCFDDERVYQIIKSYTSIPILNSHFKNSEKELMKKIVELHRMEVG